MAVGRLLALAIILLLAAPAKDRPSPQRVVQVERLELDAREATAIAEHDHTIRLLQEAGTITPAAQVAIDDALRIERELIARLREAIR